MSKICLTFFCLYDMIGKNKRKEVEENAKKKRRTK